MNGNGRRVTIGLCLLCALALGAFAAQGASAASNGTTIFTCKEVSPGTGTFTKEHCKASDAGSGNFAHVAVAENTATEIKATSEKTNAETSGPTSLVFKQTIASVELEFKTSSVSGVGTLENKKDAVTGEHYAEGTAFITISAVKVEKPAGKGCKVFTDTTEKTKGAEGAIDAHAVLSTKGQGDGVKLTPATGFAFGTFFIECTTKVEALEGTWEITGSAICRRDGATINCNHSEITAQNTLKGKGNKAGVEGSLTLSGRDPLSDPVGQFTPLSVTTVETP